MTHVRFAGLAGLWFCAAVNAVPQATFYVAPAGNDTNPGTTEQPLASFAGARDKVRAMLTGGKMTGDIEVLFRAGDYLVEQPVEFGVQDSGRDGSRVVYRNADTLGSARFVGALPLKGWVKHPSTGSGQALIWKKTGVDWAVGAMWENGKRAWRARTPNYVPDPNYPHAKAPYLYTERGSATTAVYRAGDLDPAGWTLTEQAQLAWWAFGGKPDWGRDERTISAIDVANRTISAPLHPKDSPKGWFCPGCADIGKNDRYFILGIFGLLDAPGEYYHDPVGKTLYYVPRDGDPNTQDVRAPKSTSLVSLSGESPTAHIHHLTFSGLMFDYVNYGLPHARNSAVRLSNVDHITIERCHFSRTGSYAISGLSQVRDCVVRDSWIEQTAIGGILLFNRLQRVEHPDGGTANNLITNCRIHDLGEICVPAIYNGGVMLWSANDCEISHCEIFNAARYGISIRGHYCPERKRDGKSYPDDGTHPSRNNTFQFLDIHNVGADSGDMGAVHAAYMNQPSGDCISTYRQITVRDVRAHPSMKDYPPDGIFLDHPRSCQNQIFENFETANVQGKPFRGNGNPIQTFINVSWKPGFDKSKMDYEHIGLTAEFPKEYGGKGLVDATPPSVEPPTWEKPPQAVSATEIGMAAAPLKDDMSRVEYRFECLTEGGHSSRWQAERTYVDQTLQPAKQYAYRLRVRDTARAHNETEWSAEAMASTRTADADPCKAYYDFENNGDDSQQRHPGRFTGTPRYAANGAHGKAALQMDGRGGYLTVPDHDELDIDTGDFAIALWFTRERNDKDNLRLLSKYDNTWRGYAIWGGNTSIRAEVGASSETRMGVSGKIPNLGQWIHLAVTVEHGKRLTLYLDGKVAGQQDLGAVGAANLGNAAALTIGSGSDLPWHGMIDDVRIYKRLLSEKEIVELARVGNP